jgi:Kef-type K+ transport system membrane component KefB
MHVDVALLLLILATGAAVVPVIAPRLGVPEAVGAIGYGLLVGALHLIPDTQSAHDALHLLAELGFILLMFGAGLEIDFDSVEKAGRGGLLRAMFVCLGVVAVSALLAFVFDLGVFYIVVLSATSVGLGVAVLRETGQLHAPVGQTILLLGSLGELLTLVAMTVFDVHHRVGFSLTLGIELSKLFALFAVGAVFLRFLKAWAWWHPGIFRRVFEAHDPSEVGVRAAVAACLAFVLLAVVLKIEPILGAFIAGAVSRFVFRDVTILEHKMSALSSGFFVPIFFISVGVAFDLTLLSWGGLSSALGLGALLIVARIVPCFGLLGSRDLGVREAMGAAMLLGAPLTLLVAIASLGESLGVLDAAGAGVIVLLAILVSVALPVVFRLLVGQRTRPVVDQSVAHAA